jgi:hypothetical protein
MVKSNPNVPPAMADGSTQSWYAVDPRGGKTVPPFVPLRVKKKGSVTADADPAPNKSTNPDAARPNLRVIPFIVRLSNSDPQGAARCMPGDARSSPASNCAVFHRNATSTSHRLSMETEKLFRLLGKALPERVTRSQYFALAEAMLSGGT